jgi:hypothetical protein
LIQESLRHGTFQPRKTGQLRIAFDPWLLRINYFPSRLYKSRRINKKLEFDLHPTLPIHQTQPPSSPFTMRVLLPSLLFSAVLASPTLNRAAKPIYWLLAGDSTTASNTGWGDSFLSSTLAGGASGDNYGHGGASTATFRSAGDWAKVIKAIGTYKADYAVHVTIQVRNPRDYQ